MKNFLSAATFAAAFVSATMFATSSARAANDLNLAGLPKEGRTTHALILKGGPFPYPKDGTMFGNFEGKLPKKSRGYYREYTVPTPGAKNRGARRLVCGAEAREWRNHAPAACWYTSDHYQTFQKIKE